MRTYGILAVCLALMLVCVCGCTAADRQWLTDKLQRTEQAVDVTKQQIAVLEAQSAELDKQIAAMPAGPKRDEAVELKADVDRWIVGSEEYLAKARAFLAELRVKIEAAENDLDVAEVALETTAQYLPPPWGGFLMMGSGLVLGLLRAWRNKRTAMKAIAAVDAYVIVPDANVAEVRAAAGRAGNRLVDEAQGKTTGLPF